jgi:RNA polymerase sigma factor FliA
VKDRAGGTAIAFDGSPLMPMPPAHPRISQRAITSHLGLVYRAAQAFACGGGTTVERGDLIGAGTLGLIHALEQFDASRGVSFASFATPRIRGAMLDELRRLDQVPRSVRQRLRGEPVMPVADPLSEISDESDVETALGREEDVAALARAIAALSPRERAVLTLSYHEELRLHQIAEVLGVTESRASQIRSQALATLRARLGHLRATG